MKITFLMHSMAVGGTQRQLIVLCRELIRRGHEVTVLLHYTGEPLDVELQHRGARIIDLKKHGPGRNIGLLMRLVRAVRAEKPDVVYAYLPLPNLLALLLRYLGDGCAVACGVRASDTTQPKLDWLMRLAARLERQLVRHADVVTVNSRTGAQYLCGDRPLANLIVIENGIDTETFSFDASGRSRMRGAWQVGESTPVIGCVARLDPIKDHVTLLHAFAALRKSNPEARLVCVGTIVEPYASELLSLARELRIDSAVRWVEREPQLREMYSAFDALCLSSISEGFPNVLAEGMACGVPCVATDVGDAGRILSSADFLVPPRNPEAFAVALAGALAQGRTLSEQRTQKISREFSVRNLVDRTEIALIEAMRRRDLRVARGGVRGSFK